jgi:hypothetical protein
MRMAPAPRLVLKLILNPPETGAAGTLTLDQLIGLSYIMRS